MRQRRTQPIVCLSHLRWNFVFQRPQHLLSRFASERDVYYVEEPVFENGARGAYVEEHPVDGVTVLRPHLPPMDEAAAEQHQAALLHEYLGERGIYDAILWYYTPMAMGYTAGLPYSLCVYDCMDELAMFAYAPPNLKAREQALFAKANVVFTGGRSLYYSKRKNHANVYCFPSAVDAAHFAPRHVEEPGELSSIPKPRFGFYGVVDERFDIDYLDGAAALRPEWQFVIVGPVVKIDAAVLPKRRNIHYFGQRSYDELPAHLHHWDVAMLPFARNDATRFISPTKTLEYLAAHKPVISTPIADVVDPYGEAALVAIADTPEEFVKYGERALSCGLPDSWHEQVERVVQAASWDATVSRMGAEFNRLTLTRAVAR